MSCVIIDLTGKQFGKLTVVSQNGRDPWGQVIWHCKCECGTTKDITSGHLRQKSGYVSCGCTKRDRIGKLNLTHGLSQTREYRKNQDRIKRFLKYGLTSEDFERLREKQNFRCAICGVIPTKVSNRLHDGFHIDHCHVSGRVRGLLCGNCNTGIGMLKDSEKNLLAAIEYLKG